jgi:hypothetical protein
VWNLNRPIAILSVTINTAVSGSASTIIVGCVGSGQSLDEASGTLEFAYIASASDVPDTNGAELALASGS